MVAIKFLPCHNLATGNQIISQAISLWQGCPGAGWQQQHRQQYLEMVLEQDDLAKKLGQFLRKYNVPWTMREAMRVMAVVEEGCSLEQELTVCDNNCG